MISSYNYASNFKSHYSLLSDDSSKLEGSTKDELLQSASSDAASKYLPLTGGTLTGRIKILNEKPIVFKTERAEESNGGWARSLITHVRNDDTVLGVFGIYGLGYDPYYMYLGFNDFNAEKNLRISPEGI